MRSQVVKTYSQSGNRSRVEWISNAETTITATNAYGAEAKTNDQPWKAVCLLTFAVISKRAQAYNRNIEKQHLYR